MRFGFWRQWFREVNKLRCINMMLIKHTHNIRYSVVMDEFIKQCEVDFSSVL